MLSGFYKISLFKKKKQKKICKNGVLYFFIIKIKNYIILVDKMKLRMKSVIKTLFSRSE